MLKDLNSPYIKKIAVCSWAATHTITLYQTPVLSLSSAAPSGTSLLKHPALLDKLELVAEQLF